MTDYPILDNYRLVEGPNRNGPEHKPFTKWTIVNLLEADEQVVYLFVDFPPRDEPAPSIDDIDDEFGTQDYLALIIAEPAEDGYQYRITYEANTLVGHPPNIREYDRHDARYIQDAEYAADELLSIARNVMYSYNNRS